MNNSYKNCSQQKKPAIVRECDIGGTKYIVKSVFVGDQSIKTALLKLAERKAIKEMGLDNSIS